IIMDLWKKALALLQTEVNDQVFTAWFLPIQFVSADSDSICLGIPNKFFENWIREKYISLITTAIAQVSGKNLSVKFKIVDIPFTNPAQDAAAKKIPDPAGVAEPRKNNSGGFSPDPEKRSPDKEQHSGWLKSVFAGTRQLPESRYKELGFKQNYTFDNFVVGSSNRFAHAASLAVCEKLSKVYNPLFIYGGVGLGKTHLMQAIGHEVLKNYPRVKVLYISSEEFTNQLIDAIRTKTTAKFRGMYRNVDVLLIDDVQFIAGKESTQEEFFHTFNALHDAHKQIVLCSDRSPQEIPNLEERLVSRFAWGLIADVQLPDFETRIAIMEKKSENEAIKVPKEVLYFLAENIKSNIREMEGALIRVVAYAKLSNKEISVPLAKDVLRGMLSAEEKKITVDLIQKVVADFFNIALSDMKTKKRSRSLAYPRQLAMYISRDLTGHSLPDIGGFFGGRDHTTVMHACDKIGKEIQANDKTRNLIEKLVSLIKK
ncbi:MAG: chromosomal replication initiator protein DnaA, partial [Candidatus Omnitrophica bacterium]|nr:chromosomal replication initiator protein DnaA [Candidatus Omnitrophota bacterium]